MIEINLRNNQNSTKITLKTIKSILIFYCKHTSTILKFINLEESSKLTHQDNISVICAIFEFEFPLQQHNI